MDGARGPTNRMLILLLALAGGAMLAGAAMLCFVIFVSHSSAPGAGVLAAATKATIAADSRATAETRAAGTPNVKHADVKTSGDGNRSSTEPPARIVPNQEPPAIASASAQVPRGSFDGANGQTSRQASAVDRPAALDLTVDADGKFPAPFAEMPNATPAGAADPLAAPPVDPQQPGWLANLNAAQQPGMAPAAMPGRAAAGPALAGAGMPAGGGAMPGAGGAMPGAGGAMPAAGPLPVGNARLRRRMLVLGEGGTVESERAVEAALVWLAEHQMPDGGWSFNHQLGACVGRCPDPGTHADARIGATAMALLPFLAAGYSYDEGLYQRQITGGLMFLITHMGPDGGLWESGGTMYSHGLATLALCDAYNLGPKADDSPGEMPLGAPAPRGKPPKLADERAARAEAAKLLKAAKATLGKPRKGAAGMDSSPGQAAGKFKLDPALLGAAAQGAINFIVAAQDPHGGGWRYQPQQPGDTSVVGWQLMALKAGEKAQLRVPVATLAAGAVFLDSVQTEYGSAYGYTTSMRGTPATTAIGLLARMNLGWDRSHPGLAAGAQNVAGFGPSQDDMYFNFYASQVLRNFGGPIYEKWNPLLRDYLVFRQGKQDHLAGSWEFTGGHGSPAGGRLYNTALCTLILEVYYRYELIYPGPGVSPGETAAAEEEAARRKRKLPAME